MPRKSKKMTGNGVMDVLKTIYNKASNLYDKVKAANTHLKTNRYAGRLVEAFPAVSWIPIAGTA